MSRIRQTRWYQALRRFLFPPPGASRGRRALPYIVLAGVVVGGALLVVASWQVTNSNAFCGNVCHRVMYPYIAAYQHSTHVRVDCVECHLGRTPLTDQLPRKFVHARELYALITGDYETPLVARTLRPARDTCELCHYPPQFFDDSLREVRYYESDRGNTPVSTWLVLKTGGGLHREGLGFGIHWHVENLVYYYSPDDLQQQIPWMRVVDAEGGVTEYFDIEFEPPDGFPAEEDLRLLDCIDCHNRTAHVMSTPEEAVDGALQWDRIPADIPYIRRQAVDVLSAEYTTTDEALEAIAGLEDWYAQNYPAAHTAYGPQIQQAIEVLQEMYQQNFFPEWGYDWQTYPNNIGHSDWPGCFRCHDGRHVSAQNGVVRVECNLCHSIPEVVRGGGPPTFSLSRGPEPESHLDSAWLHRHHLEFDEMCALCHDVANPGGTDDSSFCSNSACHGLEWRFADLDAPGLAERLGLLPPTPEEAERPVEERPTFASTIGPLLSARCGACHGVAAGLSVTEYEALMAGSSSGPVILPGDPDGSRIVEVLLEGHFVRLGDEELQLLISWIAGGAPER